MSALPRRDPRDASHALARADGAAPEAGRDGPRLREAPSGVPSPPSPPPAWLVEAASSDDDWELVVVLRGKVRYRAGKPAGSWMVRLRGGHYRVFSPESVVASTRLATRDARAARLAPVRVPAAESDDRE